MLQDINAQSVSQVYPMGMQFKRGDKKYRYSLAAGNLAALARLVINSNYAPGVTGHTQEDGYEGNVYAIAPIGQTYVDIADTVARAANFYQGGHMIIFSGTIFHQRYIIRSELGTGAFVRVHFIEPLVTEAPAVTDGVTVYRSPYSAVKAAGSTQVGFEPFIGVNLLPITSGYYFWLQTDGLAFITAHGGTWPGAAADQRDVYAHQDGTVDPASVKDPTSGFQKVGWLSTLTGGTASDYGDALINLQLDIG